MYHQHREVTTASELIAAASEPTVTAISVKTNLTGLPTFRLSPGQTLSGAASGVVLHFAAGQDGVQLSTNNQLECLALEADPDRCAIYNDTRVEHLGRLILLKLRTIGTIRLLASGNVRSGHIEAENIEIASADARGYT